MNIRKFVSTMLLSIVGLLVFLTMFTMSFRVIGYSTVALWGFSVWAGILLKRDGQREENGEMLKTFELFIKHSLNEPDIQVETKAKDIDEAVDKFAKSKYFGELGKAEIRNKITEIRK